MTPDDIDSYHELDLRDLVATLADWPLTAADLDAQRWRWLVELFTVRIQDGYETRGHEDWAAISAVVIRLLDRAVEAGAYSSDERLVRRLHLTTLALESTNQPDPAVALLSPRDAIDATLDALPADVEGVAREAAGWQALSRQDQLRLRRIKNVLTPALLLSSRWGDHRLAGWAQICPSLP